MPWKGPSIGRRAAATAAPIEMYRTLADLAGIQSDVQPDVQGVSLAPLFDGPDGAATARAAALLRKPAFSQARVEVTRRVHGHGHGGNVAAGT